jgi:MFS family permease
MVLLGIGAGLAFPALTIVAMADATPADSGLLSGLLNTTAQIGASLGLAVLATLSLTRTGELAAQGQDIAAALSGGYHLAWAIGLGLVLTTVVLAATLLRPDAPAVEESWSEEELLIA